MTTVIIHAFCEEYLLRWWVPHHREMFDHGVLIDYASTDRTVDVFREFAPDWEIRQSRNDCFRATDCDAEVMDVERGIDGWKIALTATEFLCCDLPHLIQSLEDSGYAAAQIQPVAMVDRQERMYADPESPLDTQCFYGYVGGWIEPYKSRLLHRHADGAYAVGRHSTNHQFVKMYPDGALLKWYGFAPWTPEMRLRKMNIQTRIPADDIAAGRGFQHMVDAERLRGMWQQECAISGKLADDPRYF